MLRIIQFEELSSLLLALPELVERQHRSSTEFSAAANTWLLALEGAFAANRMYQAGSVAMLRSECISADHGQVPTGVVPREPLTRSRVVQAVTSHALQQASELTVAAISVNEGRISEAHRVAQQVVAAALSRNLMEQNPGDTPVGRHLRNARERFRTCDDLEQAMVHIEGLVGPHDALICLDRALGPYSDPSMREELTAS